MPLLLRLTCASPLRTFIHMLNIKLRNKWKGSVQRLRNVEQFQATKRSFEFNFMNQWHGETNRFSAKSINILGRIFLCSFFFFFTFLCNPQNIVGICFVLSNTFKKLIPDRIFTLALKIHFNFYTKVVSFHHIRSTKF